MGGDDSAMLSPSITFADVAGIPLEDHLVGLKRQFQLGLLGEGLLIQLGAQVLGALALAARPVACRSSSWTS